jgi:hypothetical protein
LASIRAIPTRSLRLRRWCARFWREGAAPPAQPSCLFPRRKRKGVYGARHAPLPASSAAASGVHHLFPLESSAPPRWGPRPKPTDSRFRGNDTTEQVPAGGPTSAHVALRHSRESGNPRPSLRPPRWTQGKRWPCLADSRGRDPADRGKRLPRLAVSPANPFGEWKRLC